jgi:prepilin-type N-terminal cleavage/methylation domain-containing protein
MMRISVRKVDSAAHGTNDKSAAQRKGFVIVEVIVAMVLLAIAVTSLAALLYSVSQSGMLATGNAYRNGVLMNEVNRLEGIPYDSIAVGTTSFSVSIAPYPHTRVITVAEPVANMIKTVNVIITPTNLKYKPDTVSFTRTKARTSKALCTVGCI